MAKISFAHCRQSLFLISTLLCASVAGAAPTESAVNPVAAAPVASPLSAPAADPLLQGLKPSDIVPRVESLLEARQYSQALATADAGIAQNAQNLQLRFQRTVALQQLDREDDAIKELKSMIADFPEVPEPYNNLAVILAQRGELDEAERLLEKVISIAPTFAVARKNLGDVYLTRALNNYEAAASGIKFNHEFTERLHTLQTWFGHETPSNTATESNNTRQ